jgi:flagellum-specific peptidoglycan hydrolase FlgJ
MLGAAFLFSSCGSKKRRMASRNAKKAESVERIAGTDQMPEDPGRFVYISVESPEAYIQTFSSIAIAEMKTYGIPASITLAQGLLESGYGKGELTRKTNNHFGIKCHTGWEGDFERHDDDARGECFRKYNHPMYSFRDHSIFLSSRSRYASLFELRPDDYKAWAKGLKSAGYATDRKYPQKLISLIERYGLDQYDQKALGRERPGSPDYVTHRVQAGDTLYALSRKYRMSVEELMRLNGMDSSHLSVGQLIKVRTEKVRR